MPLQETTNTTSGINNQLSNASPKKLVGQCNPKKNLFKIFSPESAFWYEKAQNSLRGKLEQTLNQNQARNIIFFMGDGMSIPTLTAARTYEVEQSGLRFGERNALFFEKFPYSGLAKVRDNIKNEKKRSYFTDLLRGFQSRRFRMFFYSLQRRR